jgi:RNA polymerase sigma factor (TIGR02999 family)
LGAGAFRPRTLSPLQYDELVQLARAHLRRERNESVLEPTALVHEAYLRLARQRSLDWNNHAHVMGLAGQAMRRVLLDHARRRGTRKRGEHPVHLPLEYADRWRAQPVELLALGDALLRMGRLHRQRARIVQLRFFGGLSVDETAQAVGVSSATVKRQWRAARAWLQREVAGTTADA